MDGGRIDDEGLFSIRNAREMAEQELAKLTQTKRRPAWRVVCQARV